MILEIQILPLDRQINVVVLNWLMGLQPNNSLVRFLSGRDHMVVGFTTTCAISAYYH